MRRYILYAHDGSGNHGCEALVRSTCMLLGKSREEITLISARPEEDQHYGIDKLCYVIKSGSKGAASKRSIAFLKAYWDLKIKKNFRPMDELLESCAALAKRKDVALSVGGDAYCYGGTATLAQTHSMWKDQGIKTVYWGCSIEPDLLQRPEIASDIARYDLITARESISYHALKQINPNTVLVCDSAFLLEKKELPIPGSLENMDYVGINTSPLVEKCEGAPGMAHKNFENLIKYILKTTTMSVLLIPHVYWKHDDDRKVLADLQKQFEDTGRVLLIPDGNCEEIKGYISRCRFFVGARTHATIAAYSSEIPTLAVGYSVKARGIARDLFGTEDKYVLPVQEMKRENQLVASFQWLMENEKPIKEKLHMVLPEYISRVYRGRDAVIRL